MCGRYTITKRPEDIHKLIPFRGDASGFKPRFNLAPTQKAPVITMEGEWRWMRWGLIPSWAREASIGAKMINARSETAAEKPAFKRLLARNRCWVPADGFYEWKALAQGKQPYYCQVGGGALFCFAGLWDRWRTPSGEDWETFTLLTTEANQTMKHVHHRMPVIAARPDQSPWMKEGTLTPSGLAECCVSLAADQISFYPVAPKVNRAAYDAPDCIDPLPQPGNPLELNFGP